MKFLDYLKISFKNITRQRARTILTTLAIVIGAMSVIIMVSLVVSARKVMIKQLESIGALTLVTVSGNPDMERGGGLLDTNGGGDSSDGKKLDDAVVKELRETDHVVSVTPTANIWAKSMKLEGQEKKTWPNVLAYDVDSSVLDLPVLYGRGLKKGDMDKIVVGTDVLKTFGFEDNPEDAVGKNMTFILDGYNNPDWGPAPEKPPIDGDNKAWWEAQEKKTKEIKAEIVGIVNGGMDSRQSFVTLDWAKRMQTQVRWEYDEEKNKEYREKGIDTSNMNFQKVVKEDMISKNGYATILLKVDNPKNVVQVGEEIKKKGFGVATAEDIIKEISKVLTVIGIIAGTIGGIALFVAAIGIINTMIMAIYERTREIGVMRACGATKSTIRKLFTFEAAFFGFFGGIIGLIVSFGLAKIANIILDKVAESESLPVSDFISFPVWLVFGVVAFTTFIGFLSGIYPAHRAAKLDPVEALRYE